MESNGLGILPPLNRAMVMARLRELGLSGAGAQQVLDGQVLSNPQDRLIVAQILGLTLAPQAAQEMHDFPGGYAARFDGIAPGSGSKVSSRMRIDNY
jgi:hypothetical protein